MNALRIGVNALYLIPGGVGGTEIYLRQLLQAFARVDRENEFFVYTNRETRDLVPSSPAFQDRPQPVNAVNRPARILYEQFRLPHALHRDSIDVIFNPGFTAPVFSRKPSVTVFHDLQHVKHPEYFKKIDLPFWQLLLFESARRSEKLIAVSEPTRTDVLEHYRLPGGQVVTIPHGVEEEFFSLERIVNEGQPFVLCVSTLHPHKNIATLVRVFANIRQRHPPLRLLLAGMRGFHASKIEALIRDLNLTQSVIITGWLPREELYRLYASAKVFAYPSTFEGFGMPVLEAMAARVPLACSDIPPLKAITNGTAALFDPLDATSMAAQLQRLLSDPAFAAELTGRAYQRARQFTWDSAARETLAVLRSVAELRGG